MRAIIKLLPTQGRQTALFSATQTKNVADLARLAIQNKPVYVEALPPPVIARALSLSLFPPLSRSRSLSLPLSLSPSLADSDRTLWRPPRVGPIPCAGAVQARPRHRRHPRARRHRACPAAAPTRRPAYRPRLSRMRICVIFSNRGCVGHGLRHGCGRQTLRIAREPPPAPPFVAPLRPGCRYAPPRPPTLTSAPLEQP